MKYRTSKTFTKLFWQISAIFLIVLIVFAGITGYISVQAARNYSVEVNQKLNLELAKNTVEVIKPQFVNGVVNEEAIAEIMHSMMVINPSVEVYLLDPAGKILSYVAPYKVVKLEEVSLGPIMTFLEDKQDKIIYGDDPRNPGEKKIFSAAEVKDGDILTGYVYIVLASQDYVSASHMVLGSYILGLSTKSIIAILLVSALVGLFLLWIITKRLNLIIRGIELFRSGNLKSRIPVKSNSDLDKIGIVFNEMAGTIEKNIEELKGIDNLRKELISNVSHDLRTPVASIQGYAETLLMKGENISTDERKKYLDTIYKSCERLQKLVNDLFELSKLESHQIKLNKEPFSIAELVNDVASKYRLISQRNGISINTTVNSSIPLVEADISLIDRVLQNLIDNAVRFCKEGDYINIVIEPESDQMIKLSIADSGAGIEKASLPHIFERYYKGDAYKQSSGLGLAIVKRIIDLHQTNIQVQSIKGKGTTFTFNLPVANIA
jgi:signal transduction histidine kinase